LLKKYRSLEKDLEVRKMTLREFPKGRGQNDVSEISGLKIKSKIFKARLMCRDLKQSSLRLIYCYDEDVARIIFVEIYFKGDQQVEDKERILRKFE